MELLNPITLIRSGWINDFLVEIIISVLDTKMAAKDIFWPLLLLQHYQNPILLTSRLNVNSKLTTIVTWAIKFCPSRLIQYRISILSQNKIVTKMYFNFMSHLIFDITNIFQILI